MTNCEARPDPHPCSQFLHFQPSSGPQNKYIKFCRVWSKGSFFKHKLSETTPPITLLITKLAVELIVQELFDNFHQCALQTSFWGQNISRYIAINVSQKIYDPNVKFHNNPFSRYYVNRELTFRGNHANIQTCIHTYRQGGILLGVFSFITLLETWSTKIWRDLDQCTDKILILYIQIYT